MVRYVGQLRRSKLLLTCSICGTLYVLFLLYTLLQAVFDNGIFTGGIFSLYSGITMAWFFPHVVGVALAVFLDWRAWYTKKRKYALYASVLYAVSAVLLAGIFLNVLILAALSFVCFYRQDGLKATYKR